MLNNYDAQFRVRALVPDFDSYLDRYRTQSAQARQLIPHSLDCAYGSSPLERLDVFLPETKGEPRPVHVFFHGGYWRAFDKSDYSFVARPITEAGAIAVIANYGLMPAVTMGQLVTQCRSAIRWICENATQKDPKAIIKWNNEMIGLRLCDLPDQVQEYFETYIPQFCHPPSKVKFFFDVYDVEEGVL